MGIIEQQENRGDEEEMRKEVAINFRGPFFHDPYFSTSWSILDTLKTDYEDLHGIEHGKFSIEKDLPLRSCIITSPAIDEGNTINYYPTQETTTNEMAKAKEVYQVILDTANFRPDEISVYKTSDSLIIEGKHEEKSDPIHSGYISRSFVRKYKFPWDVDQSGNNGAIIRANMSADGILLIELPKAPSKIKPLQTTETEQSQHQEAQEETGGLINKMKHLVVEPILHLLPNFHSLIPSLSFWHKSLELGIQSDKEYFKILVDVKEFSPDELEITCTDYYVIVEGGHDEVPDSHGSIQRSFTRRFDLPKCIGSNQELSCSFLPGGILEIKAPKTKKAIEDDEEVEKWRLPLEVSEEAQRELDEREKRRQNLDLDTFNFISMQ